MLSRKLCWTEMKLKLSPQEMSQKQPGASTETEPGTLLVGHQLPDGVAASLRLLLIQFSYNGGKTFF